MFIEFKDRDGLIILNAKYIIDIEPFDNDTTLINTVHHTYEVLGSYDEIKERLFFQGKPEESIVDRNSTCCPEHSTLGKEVPKQFKNMKHQF